MDCPNGHNFGEDWDLYSNCSECPAEVKEKCEDAYEDSSYDGSNQ